MRFRDLLNRLWPGRSSGRTSARSRYADASRLENTTQSHYRSVTESDARGQSTKADDAGPPPRRK